MKICCDVPEAAEILRVSRATIYNWMREGKVEGVKIGGRRLIKIDSIKRLVGAE